jgi:large subunit ribosomal protein L24
MSLARIRKGDTVVVISGKDKGKTGRVMGIDLERPARARRGDQHREAPHQAHDAGPRGRDPRGRAPDPPLEGDARRPGDGQGHAGSSTQVEADGSKTRIAVKSGKAIRHEVGVSH